MSEVVVDMLEWLARKQGFESASALEDHMADLYHEVWMEHVRQQRVARKLERSRRRK